MTITLTPNFIAENGKKNKYNIIAEVLLDSGLVKWGLGTGGFADVQPILAHVSSVNNKLDTAKSISTRGNFNLILSGRATFTSVVASEYLKNRRVNIMLGFDAPGFLYSDYAEIFSGKIFDWDRQGDTLTIVVIDDFVEGLKKVPLINARKTQYIDFRDQNPVDIMKTFAGTLLDVAAGKIETTNFDAERDFWFSNWTFTRVITEPEDANKYLNELQRETNSFIFNNGNKIDYTAFKPPALWEAMDAFSDLDILGDLKISSGYASHFFNRIEIYYDYDESGGDKEFNYESAAISLDEASQSAAEWDGTSTKRIRARWMRSNTWTQPERISGVVVIYHVSTANGYGIGELIWNVTDQTLAWKKPGGSAGPPVSASRNGKIQLFDADNRAYIRCIIDVNSTERGGNGGDKWTQLTSGATARGKHATAVDNGILFQGRVYIFGGVEGTNTFVKTLWAYDISKDEYTQLPSPPAGMAARNYHTMVSYNNALYVCGGSDATTIFDDLWKYDKATQTWTQLTSLGSARSKHTAVVFGDDMYVFGGANGVAGQELCKYNFITDAWTPLTSASNSMKYHKAVVFADDMYGCGGVEYTKGVINELSKYNFITDTWTQLTSGATARQEHGLTAYDGFLYTYGGSAPSATVGDLWRYEIASDKWAQLITAPISRTGMTLVAFNDFVYVFGGTDEFGSRRNSMWRYEIATMLPSVDATNPIKITSLAGSTYAGAIANKLLSRYRNPIATVKFDTDINRIVTGTSWLKIAAYVNLTSNDAFAQGQAAWLAEPMMITSARPDWARGKMQFEMIQAVVAGSTNGSGGGGAPSVPGIANSRIAHAEDNAYAWDAAKGLPAYGHTDGATMDQHAFIGDANNELGVNKDPGFKIM